MATQRDLAVMKKEMITKNIAALSRFHGMSTELSRLVFKENALEKPTQNLFNHLSYYLISIVDANISSSLSWPLYDTKAERAYRNEIASFISGYSSKGLLSPVMSSYLVNPGCYKVTILMYQLSQLAVERTLLRTMKEERQLNLYREMTEKYRSQQEQEDFVASIEKVTNSMRSKLSHYLSKRKTMERIAELFRKKITEMERTLATVNAQNYINNIVDGFMKTHEVDEETKLELEKIKNFSSQSKIFDSWLAYVDEAIDGMEKAWDTKISSLLHTTDTLYQTTQALVDKTTGGCDRSSYMVEYNHKTDEIPTKDLQDQVNSQQKYVLRNLVKDGQLNFPNLVRAFVISISFILKQNEIGDEIYNFNEYLEGSQRNYSEIVSAMRILIERVLNAESRLQATPPQYNCSLSIKEFPEIPPLPDLSNLKLSKDCNLVLFDTFTPFNLSKYQFNLRRKNSASLFARPQSRSLITPFHTAPRDNFLKTIISCRIGTYDRQSSQDNQNLSVISHVDRANETIAECSSGFTKQQILRILSTKKSSSSKKFKYNTERPNINIKKGGLFNESFTSNESNCLIRSYSSPNLCASKEKRCHSKVRGRQLSVMQEYSPQSILEMSGITTLDQNVNYSTPQDCGNADSYRNNMDASSLPLISVTSDTESRINKILDVQHDFEKEMGVDNIVSPIPEEPKRSLEVAENSDSRIETPKTNIQINRKSGSLDKIISRFKKVRAYPPEKKEVSSDIITIAEEKETMKNDNLDICAVKKVLLPDLLSPSCSGNLNVNINTDYLDEMCTDIDEVPSRKPRQSLGTVLGVDQTFLDQFDLID